MAGYPYGNPQYPPAYPPQYPPQQLQQPQQNQIYPNIYPQAFGVPGQQTAPGHHGFQYPSAPPPMPGAMPGGMPGVAPLPTVNPTPVYPGYQPQPPQPVEWIPCTDLSAEAQTYRAVVAGYEGHDGSPLWVIRARHEEDLIPGKLAIKHRSAFVPWGSKEIRVNNFEVCVAQPDRVRWVQSQGGSTPPNAIPGGRTSTGETLYIGRAKQQGSLTPGKIHPSHKVMYMSFAGEEIPHKVYEVLCSV